ncbi:hypothetical protein RJ639_024633 [Escallonia herrerae]|uniref:GAG-pre-integrase domain-containing protein n=1 Tax=Escallonia herrerae TaxID=1293975 RepID=A0AA88UZ46_9ASTE|nr:hypothetical protein RJ639_024633 [Escallonia herrerae]
MAQQRRSRQDGEGEIEKLKHLFLANALCSIRVTQMVVFVDEVSSWRVKKDESFFEGGSTITLAATTVLSSDLDADATKLCHICLGHISEKGMDMPSKQGLLGSKKIEKLDFYGHCVFGKQCRVKFSQTAHTNKGTVDYIHSDLWGPSTVSSKGGVRYMLTFIDDFSRKKEELIDAGKGHGDGEKVEPEKSKQLLYTEGALFFGFQQSDILGDILAVWEEF